MSFKKSPYLLIMIYKQKRSGYISHLMAKHLILDLQAHHAMHLWYLNAPNKTSAVSNKEKKKGGGALIPKCCNQ